MLPVLLYAKSAKAKPEMGLRVMVGESTWPRIEGMLWGPLRNQRFPGEAKQWPSLHSQLASSYTHKSLWALG